MAEPMEETGLLLGQLMGQLMAKTGSMMVCDKGTAAIPLVASGDAEVSICGALAAVVSDVLPGTNINPFGMCVKLQSACTPRPNGQWVNPIVNGCIIGKKESLLEGAELPCTIGGTISVMSAAQATVLVGQNMAKIELPICEDDPDPSKATSAASAIRQIASGLFHTRDPGALASAGYLGPYHGQTYDDAEAFVAKFYPHANRWVQNAARHGMWMSLLLSRQKKRSATAIGKTHERHGGGTPTDHWVDNFNNIQARRISSGKREEQFPELIRRHVSQGTFITDPEDKRIPPQLRCRERRR